MRAVLMALAFLAGCGELAFFQPPGTADGCVPLSCASLGLSCGDHADGCGGLLTCGTCPTGTVCGVHAAGQCGATDDPCPLGPGEALRLGAFSSGPGPAALDTDSEHLVLWTAWPTSSSPGRSRLRQVDKCGLGPVEVLTELGDGDIRGGAHSLAVEGQERYFANPRIGEVRRIRVDGSGEVRLAAGLDAPCGLAVDAPRDRLLVAECGTGRLLAIALSGGEPDVLLTGEGFGRRRLVVDGERLYWSSTEPPGVRAWSLDGSGPPETLAEELATPSDLAVRGGVPHWIRPEPDGGSSLVVLGPDRPRVVARFAHPHLSLALYDGGAFLVDDERLLRVDLASETVDMLADMGGQHVHVDAHGLYVAQLDRQTATGEDHVLWRVGLP